MSQAAYPGSRPAVQIIERLRSASGHSAHEFWPDDVVLLDPKVIDASRVHGARQVTDTYLLALAVKHGGRLATFDAGIVFSAVRGAERRHLVALP